MSPPPRPVRGQDVPTSVVQLCRAVKFPEHSWSERADSTAVGPPLGRVLGAYLLAADWPARLEAHGRALVYNERLGAERCRGAAYQGN